MVLVPLTVVRLENPVTVVVPLEDTVTCSGESGVSLIPGALTPTVPPLNEIVLVDVAVVPAPAPPPDDEPLDELVVVWVIVTGIVRVTSALSMPEFPAFPTLTMVIVTDSLSPVPLVTGAVGKLTRNGGAFNALKSWLTVVNADDGPDDEKTSLSFLDK